MVKRGIITEFNGEYGLIKCGEEIVDFDKNDLSTPINVGDKVEYREERGDYLIIARNIKVVDE